jgi:hypothetical protein
LGLGYLRSAGLGIIIEDFLIELDRGLISSPRLSGLGDAEELAGAILGVLRAQGKKIQQAEKNDVANYDQRVFVPYLSYFSLLGTWLIHRMSDHLGKASHGLPSALGRMAKAKSKVETTEINNEINSTS